MNGMQVQGLVWGLSQDGVPLLYRIKRTVDRPLKIVR